MYPEGDRSAPPSGRMPKGGFYFDTIVRQEPIDDETLDVEDNLEEFGPISDAMLQHFAGEADRLRQESDRAILGNFGGMAFGDIALVPAPWLKTPQGHPRRGRVVHEHREPLRLRLRAFQPAVRDRRWRTWRKSTTPWATACRPCSSPGTDFGMQNGPFISPAAYRKLYQPFHRRVNDWVHEHTPWKTFIHCCGSVIALLPDIIDAGFDILNPVQCSAAGMDARTLKERFGDKLTFWGGGVDTQKTLPFGTPDEVRRQVRERIEIFGRGGGFVFNAVHNVQAAVPAENLVALYEAARAALETPCRRGILPRLGKPGRLEVPAGSGRMPLLRSVDVRASLVRRFAFP